MGCLGLAYCSVPLCVDHLALAFTRPLVQLSHEERIRLVALKDITKPFQVGILALVILNCISLHRRAPCLPFVQCIPRCTRCQALQGTASAC